MYSSGSAYCWIHVRAYNIFWYHCSKCCNLDKMDIFYLMIMAKEYSDLVAIRCLLGLQRIWFQHFGWLCSANFGVMLMWFCLSRRHIATDSHYKLVLVSSRWRALQILHCAQTCEIHLKDHTVTYSKQNFKIFSHSQCMKVPVRCQSFPLNATEQYTFSSQKIVQQSPFRSLKFHCSDSAYFCSYNQEFYFISVAKFTSFKKDFNCTYLLTLDPFTWSSWVTFFST